MHERRDRPLVSRDCGEFIHSVSADMARHAGLEGGRQRFDRRP